jgi:hypothetical protein
MKHLIRFYLLFAATISFAQSIPYSNNTVISVLTCAPGDELYSKFGHSAFRVQDFSRSYDIVYNYGVFDQDQPLFYLNFAKGKMIYKLDKAPYNYFYRLYEYENRAVKKQVLNLNSSQRKKLIAFLENNAKPENASYPYDFFYNNCATKIRSVLDTVFPNEIIFNDEHISTSFTMRDLINNKVTHNSWSNVGINIALGSVIDHQASSDDYQFLPEYLFQAFQHAKIKGLPLVTATTTLLETDEKRLVTKSFSLLSPYVILSLVALLIIWISYRDYRKSKRTKPLDFILLLICGLTGVLSLLLWFATNHTATVNNFNILWAFAPNLVMAFLIFNDHHAKFKTVYFKLLTALMLLLGVIWLFKIEAFALGMAPVFVALFVRYLYLSKYFTK